MGRMRREECVEGEQFVEIRSIAGRKRTGTRARRHENEDWKREGNARHRLWRRHAVFICNITLMQQQKDALYPENDINAAAFSNVAMPIHAFHLDTRQL